MSDKERMTDNEIIKALECCSANYIACKECPFNSKSFCERYVIENAFDFVKRQRAEIERLKRENKILSINADNAFQEGLNEAQDLYAEQVKNEVKAEAIKEFADRFDDVLAGLRDEYAYNGRPEYGLVCEVVHHKLLKTVKEMVGVAQCPEREVEENARNLKAEAIKEFAERMGEYIEYRCNENCDFVPYVRLRDIEKVEKEMVGAEDET